MNRDDIIRIAREADAGLSTSVITHERSWVFLPDDLERFAALVAAKASAAEREACAKVADEYTEIHPQQKHIFEFDRGWVRSAVHIASSIRARGELK